ncbi:NAD(P)/FAD-dependent oxidoreductase [Castellaniella sp.]|uniref:NAD(P)/FAD-dependent oxidoreductase n=1 Tax=Castellaniella sp. TaxID=1955812 RepID=UPI003C794407
MSRHPLYPIYENNSGWNQLLPPREPRQIQKPDSQYAYVVVGAGYTGMAAARRLAELNPDEEILLCDAGVVDSGSSGRNSGFMISEPHVARASHESRQLFAQRTHKQLRLYQTGVQALESLVKQHQIDCDWQAVGKYHAAATAQGAEHLREYLDGFQEWGVECRELSAGELAHDLGTRYYDYGYWTSHNVLIQPAALIRGLADHLPENVHLSENTPVTAISATADGAEVHIGAHSVRTRAVMLATNGFLKELGFLRDRLAIIYTYAGLSPELSAEDIARSGAVENWGILPAHRLGTTLRRIHGNRFLVRTSYSYEKASPLPEVEALLRGRYVSRFPQLSDHSFESVWGGTTALTRNGAFYLGQPAKNVFAAVGCNGVGILKGTVYGQLMAEMAMGGQSDLLSDALSLAEPSWLPPEPLRSLAIHSAIRFERWRAGKEM